MDDHTAVRSISVRRFSTNVCIIYLSFPQHFGGMSSIHFKNINMHHSIFSRISRGSQFQVEDLFAPNTSSLANEMTDPEKVVSIKEEDSMEIYCDDKPLISNLPPDTVMENNNTTQEKPSPVLEFFSSCSC